MSIPREMHHPPPPLSSLSLSIQTSNRALSLSDAISSLWSQVWPVISSHPSLFLALSLPPRTEPRLHSFLHLSDAVLRDADKKIERNKEVGPLAGSFGCRTCRRRSGLGFWKGIGPFDAVGVRKLRESGAIIFGKTNLDDFGIESTTEGAFITRRNAKSGHPIVMRFFIVGIVIMKQRVQIMILFLMEYSYFIPKAGKELCDAKYAKVSSRALENQIAELVSQTNIEEQECQVELNACNQVQVKLINLGRKTFLMEAIMKESIELQDLTRYPY
ncbi:hypothetical protein RHMOL_Rhmol08G0199600 [Rhododendron molle]|uniref:Uncharacterized protein n=4 Tax=Rhododendron molle TaxID=49168 RepID=A0ACC0MQ94_RHOML|nr:hypothetical protein RHMOL_Rhmol08G0199600 [Rhododendron molle]KAI8543207.1 hypothetical protein RHMOL_Rhmol08G0199600 [Rhododendron molle]KAI8543208.1 hypothetical protein RHMOL_Rhmol08G0199600 [Rhododendron molle]KAI8543209.1 hypothetical protein RHMOL_Rhmol08G0199600 [Rhododendron molle]